ncbi:MAG: TolC family protein [Balneola sp.]
MKKLFLLAAFSVLFISTSITAQQKRTITLNEAIQLALENNYQLKQAENNLDLAEYRILSEKADFLPSLSSRANYSTQAGQQFVQETLTFTDLTSTSGSASINASIPIFNGFNNILTLRSSESSKLSSEENLKRAKENIIFETATRFLTVLLNKQQLEDAKESLETSVKLLEQTKAQVEVGSRPSVDLFNQEATVANDEFTITQRENALKLSRLQLVRSLQIDPLVEYEFAVPEFDPESSITSSTAGLQINALVNEALTNRSDLKSSEYNIESLEYQLQIAKGALYPTLNGSASLSSSYSDQATILVGRDPNTNDPIFEDVNFSDQFFDQRVNKSIGLSLNLPIFNNWNRMTQIQSAQVNLKNAELGLENTKLQVIQEITQALNDYSSYSAQLKASEKSLIASEKAFETQQERYNVGASTLIELSQAQTQYFNAQSARTSALYNLIFQEKLLDYYVGKLSGEDINF